MSTVPERRTSTPPDLSDTYTLIAAAPIAAQRRAVAIAIALFAVWCGLLPFARLPWPHIAQLVPMTDGMGALVALVATGSLTVALRRSRLRAVVVLAGGYLVTALLAVPRALTVPDPFTQGGLPGAALQQSAWLDLFRQAALPVCAIGYVFAKRCDWAGAWRPASLRADVAWMAVTALGAGAALTLLATTGHNLLPRLADGGITTGAMLVAGGTVSALTLAALFVLLSRRPWSVLDLWLLVVLWAWLGAVVLCDSSAPFDVGFYAGRLYGLLALSLVPLLLLVEASRILRRLDTAIALAEERNRELLRSRQALARAQRFEAIGQLTGGVAHDFNNLLTAVIGNLELIIAVPADAARIARFAAGAMKAAQHGEHLVRQLLTYARQQIARPQLVDLDRLIADSEDLIRCVASDRIELVIRLGAAADRVRIDPGQFETAILNLVANARDAMPAEGRITIETRAAVIDAQQATEDPEVTPGLYVVVAICDTGSGMTPAVLEKAFDPFFTTKEAGKGSGLGLSQVYGFAKTAGGHARIRSTPGGGTSVELYLPKAAEPLAPSAPEAAATPPLPAARNSETILVVEDDAEVLAATAENLRELGYHVVTAIDSRAALELLRGDQPIDLLFSDVVIPGGKNGAQLAVAARRVRPALKVLLTSGYTAAALGRDGGLDDGLSVVDKPYRREDLARKLRAMIDG
jgi:signal transduction histidine kinase/CheY-like chemotaxis protein